MKKLPIIWGIILVILLSTITPITSMKLNDGWIYDEDTGTLSIEFSGETEESYILKYGLIECSEVGVIYTHEYSFPSNSIGYIETSYDKGKTWTLKKEYNESSISIRDLFVSLTLNSIWIRFTVESSDGNGFWKLSDIELIGDTRGMPPQSMASTVGIIVDWWQSPFTFTITTITRIGIREIHYLIDGFEEIFYKDAVTITISGSGIHRISFWAIDILGNEEIPREIFEIKMDYDIPNVRIKSPTNGLYVFNNKLPIIVNKTIIIGGFNIEIEASDNVSGIYQIYLLLNGEIINKAIEEPYSRYCGIKHNGKDLLRILAEDRAGNMAETTLDIYYYNFF